MYCYAYRENLEIFELYYSMQNSLVDCLNIPDHKMTADSNSVQIVDKIVVVINDLLFGRRVPANNPFHFSSCHVLLSIRPYNHFGEKIRTSTVYG